MKVTVYMVVYNGEKYIAHAIESVLTQTYKDFEFLIVNDGSTDKTEQIIKTYDDDRIRYICQEHKNFASGMNRAIVEAKGKYVLGVDSDDYIAEDYLEKMVACADKHPDIDFFYPYILKAVNEHNKPASDAGSWKPYKDYSNNKTLLLDLYKTKHSLVPNPGSLKRKSLFKRVGLYEELETCEDFVFLCRNALKIRFKRVDDSSSYFYRRLPSGNSAKKGPREAIKERVLSEMKTLYPAELSSSGTVKLLICSPWNNAWIRYYQRYFSRNNKYEVKVYRNKYTANYMANDEWMVEERKVMDWADVVLFGWTDPFLNYWSHQPKDKNKKYIAFLRSYELFNTSQPWETNWANVDHLVFVNPVIRATFLQNVEGLSRLASQPFKTPAHFIPNAVDLDEWKFVDRKPSGKIAWVSGVNYKKGIQLLAQFAAQMPDSNYIYPIGSQGDLRMSLYFSYIKNSMKLEGRLGEPEHYKSGVQAFLKDKSFELMTSPVEGHPNAVLETMAVGMKPIVHNFPGSKNLFPEKYIWNTVDEAIEMLNGDYNSAEYRGFIEDKYDMNKVYPLIEALF